MSTLYVDSNKENKVKINLFCQRNEVFSEVRSCDVSWSLLSCISLASWAILKFFKVVESFVFFHFANYFEQLSFNQVFKAKGLWWLRLSSQFLRLSSQFLRFLCVSPSRGVWVQVGDACTCRAPKARYDFAHTSPSLASVPKGGHC